MSLDLYAFIALAPSSSTVSGLIEMVKSDNDLHQWEMDRRGNAGGHLLNVHIYVVTISLHRVPDPFFWDSSLSPASPIQNMSYLLYTQSTSCLVTLSSPFMTLLLKLARITFHCATGASTSRLSLTVLAYHHSAMNFRTTMNPMT